MTCIVGVVEDGTVWMGGDGVSCTDWDLLPRMAPKVFQCGPLLLGPSGDGRFGDLLRHRLIIPPRIGDLDAWLSVAFVDAIRACLTESGYTHQDGGREDLSGALLIGIEGRLFRMDSYYAMTEAALPYCALGGGEDYALGALYALTSLVLPPSERIRTALTAAAMFSASVRGPFTVLRLDPTEAAL